MPRNLFCHTVVIVSAREREDTWTRAQALEEIERVLLDAERHAEANGGRWNAAMLSAAHDATKRTLSIRDEAQAGAVDFARLVGHWVYERADGSTGRASYEAALRAVRDDPDSNWLTADLYRFIDTYLDGSLTGEGFVRMLNKPLLGRPRVKPPPPAPGDFPFNSAEPTLRGMLERASVDPVSDPASAFEVFAAFAKLRAGASATHRVEDDGFLWEYWTAGRRFTVDLCRQFSLADGDGDYSHMEQLHLTFVFSAEPGDDDGTLWSHGDLDAWLSGVRATAAFRAITTRKPTSATIELFEV